MNLHNKNDTNKCTFRVFCQWILHTNECTIQLQGQGNDLNKSIRFFIRRYALCV